MGKSFTSRLPVDKAEIPSAGVIKRVTHSWFASCVDEVACGKFHFGKSIYIGYMPEFNTGDILKIFPNGTIQRLWDIKSLHNCLFVTEACNFRCLMCPQPPGKDNPEHHADNMRILELLPDDKVDIICITGGEPMLFPDRIVAYYDIIRRRFPSAHVDVLTNGSLLSDFNMAKHLALAAPADLCYCVSIHGDTPSLAESIMGNKGGWDKAINGIMNLARLQQGIELRFVLTRKNAKYVEDVVRFFYRNAPFVSHVALMGQEITGEAEKNYEQIWIEPAEYADKLKCATEFLLAMNINVSIYNIPLCLLADSVRKVAERSISDWKQCYQPVCRGCKKMEECCGFFTTSKGYIPHGISRFH